jgi:2-dehydropantoate 2-reductase
MKITIAGSGAMGCRFGAALFEAGHQVTLLDGWREHVTAINEAGLRVTDATGTRTLAVPAVLFPAPPRPDADRPDADPDLPVPDLADLAQVGGVAGVADITGVDDVAEVAGVGGVGGVAGITGVDHVAEAAGVGGVADMAEVGGVDHVAEVADLVVVFAKATGTAAVATAAAGAIGPSTLVLTLQNGLGNIEALLARVPADRLLAGTTTLGTELLGPGHIRALGTGETVLGPLGAFGGAATKAAELIASTLADAGIWARTSPNALEVIWAKVAFNCVMNSLCSIASIPVSALARYDGFDALAGSILDEVAAVAGAEGVTVDTTAALRLMHAQFDPSASGDHLASMLQDLMNGRRTEIAHLNGAIAQRAAARGIDAPVNAAISRLVGLLEATWTGRVNRLHPELP